MNDEASIDERTLRHFIFEWCLAKEQPPVIEELIAGFSTSREECRKALLSLESQRLLVLLPGTDRILMAHPFSGIVTPFCAATANGKRYFANCAWDAIAFHVMLQEDVSITSFCHQCGRPIDVTLSGQRVGHASPVTTVVFLALPAAQWWKDIILSCSNTMVFFCSTEHQSEWSRRTGASDAGAVLTIQQVITLSIPIYRTKMALDYQRPSVAVLRAHFAEMGLTGAFWDL
jgi:Alkylmercury lyase